MTPTADGFALSEEESAALSVIVANRQVVMNRDGFEAATGMTEALTLAGLVVAWERDAEGKALAEPLVTLTPLAAVLLRVEIVELGPNWQVWDEAGKPPRPLATERGEREYRIPYPHLVIDPRPGPAQEVEYLLDAYSGEPVTILGRVVPIDRRMKARRAG